MPDEPRTISREHARNLPDAARPFVVPLDMACMACRYNLRGLSTGGKCPECGELIARSVRGDRLGFADPSWVRRLSHGMSWAGATLVIGFACGFLAAASVTEPGPYFVTFSFLAIPTLMGVRACWLFSAPEPRRVAADAALSWRRVARICAVTLASLFLFVTGAILLLPWTWPLIPLGVAVATVGVFAAGRYAADLARRMSDLDLASQTKAASAGCTFVGAAVTFASVSAALSFLFPNAVVPGDVLFALLQMGGCVTLVFFVGCGIWTLVLIGTFTSRLGEAVKQAEKNWTPLPDELA